jgi:hypothetical protein
VYDGGSWGDTIYGNSLQNPEEVLQRQGLVVFYALLLALFNTESQCAETQCVTRGLSFCMISIV